MQISARVLGQDYDLNAEEMNRVLAKLGFLKGTPGNYSVTLKALPYSVEKAHHRGTGGYSCYNRYWTTRTFDDSIKDALDVSAELISEVRNEIATERAARYTAQAAARAQANKEFLAKLAAEKAAQEAAAQTALKTEALMAKWKNVGKIGLVASAAVIIGYGIYKTTPTVKAWWSDRKRSTNEKEHNAA